MAQQTNIVAKNAAAASVTFDALSPSAGESSPATFQATLLGDTPMKRPRAEMMARRNASKDGRKMFLNTFVPIRATINGVDTVVSIVPIRTECTVADSVTDAQLADAWAYHHTIAASPQGVSLMTTRYAPT